MIIEYDTEDRCIRVDDVAVSHADAEKLMAEHETAVAALENAWCSTNGITPRRTTLTDTMTDLEPELIDVLKLLGWHEL